MFSQLVSKTVNPHCLYIFSIRSELFLSRSDFETIITGSIILNSAIVISLSDIIVDGYAEEIITKSLSRFARGGLIRVFFRGSIFSMMPLLPSSLPRLPSGLLYPLILMRTLSPGSGFILSYLNIPLAEQEY